MLSPDAAKVRLQGFLLENARERRLERVQSLPAAARTAAFGLLARNAQGERLEYFEYGQCRRNSAGWLVEATRPERMVVWEALLPRLAEHVEATWELFRWLPYQTHWQCRGFRAPDSPMAAGFNCAGQLQTLLAYELGDYEQGIEWLAAWAPYLHLGSAALGPLLAAAIDAGGTEGDAVFDILVASARGEHEIGAMSRHVVNGLLCASRPEGWQLIERLLLSAQREEGLRQTILEAADLVRPEPFRRLLRVLLEHDLLRFSSTIRAVGVWFGVPLEAASANEGRRLVVQFLEFLENPPAAEEAIYRGEASSAYLALFAQGREDVLHAIRSAQALVTDPDPERRFAAVYFLNQTLLAEAHSAVVPLLDDPELRTAITAAETLQVAPITGRASPLPPGIYDGLRRLVERMPAKLEPASSLWPWLRITAERPAIADLLPSFLDGRSPTLLIPLLRSMGPGGRCATAKLLANQPDGEGEALHGLLTLAGDVVGNVREYAFQGLVRRSVSPADLERLEGLLTRGASDLRRAVLTFLGAQQGVTALASADRLLVRSNVRQRLAGLELLGDLAKNAEFSGACRERAARYRAAHSAVDEQQETLLGKLLETSPEASEERAGNILGLANPALRTRPRVPRPGPQIKLQSSAAVELLRSLDDCVHGLRETPVRVPGWNPENPEQGAREMLLGDITYQGGSVFEQT